MLADFGFVGLFIIVAIAFSALLIILPVVFRYLKVVPYNPNPSLFKKFNIPPNEVHTFYRPGEVTHDKRGKPVICDKCQGTGYYGQIALFETVRLTPEQKKILVQAKSSTEITAALRKAGMLYMQEQSIKKVSAGITSINEVIRNFSDNK